MVKETEKCHYYLGSNPINPSVLFYCFATLGKQLSTCWVLQYHKNYTSHKVAKIHHLYLVRSFTIVIMHIFWPDSPTHLPDGVIFAVAFQDFSFFIGNSRSRQHMPNLQYSKSTQSLTLPFISMEDRPPIHSQTSMLFHLLPCREVFCFFFTRNLNLCLLIFALSSCCRLALKLAYSAIKSIHTP